MDRIGKFLLILFTFEINIVFGAQKAFFQHQYLIVRRHLPRRLTSASKESGELPIEKKNPDIQDQKDCISTQPTGPRSLSDRLNSLSFGFEVLDAGRSLVDPSNVRIQNSPPPPDSTRLKADWGNVGWKRPQAGTSAVLKSQGMRSLGCAPLLSAAIVSELVKSQSDVPYGTSIDCSYYSLRCSKGHTWRAVKGTPASFECPECARQKPRNEKPRTYKRWDMKDVKALAQERGGQVLSTEFKGTKVPITFQCRCSHIWEARVENVAYRGSWCPKCAKLKKQDKKRLPLQEMHDTAAFFNGTLVSTEYRGVNQKLHWRCQRGHEFVQYPNNIRRRRSGGKRPAWCPECAKLDGPPRFFVKRRLRRAVSNV